MQPKNTKVFPGKNLELFGFILGLSFFSSYRFLVEIWKEQHSPTHPSYIQFNMSNSNLDGPHLFKLCPRPASSKTISVQSSRGVKKTSLLYSAHILLWSSSQCLSHLHKTNLENLNYSPSRRWLKWKHWWLIIFQCRYKRSRWKCIFAYMCRVPFKSLSVW